MAIEIDGPAGEVRKLWGSLLSARESRWLWMCLKYFYMRRPTQFFGNATRPAPPLSPFEGDIDFELEQLLRTHPNLIPMLQAGRVFNQIEHFGWIHDDIRQLHWLIGQTHNSLGFDVPDARARFSDRDYFICLIDLIAMPVAMKQEHLDRLHQAWRRHLKSTAYLDWFSDGDEPGRCDFAWRILESRLESTLLDSLRAFPVLGDEFRKYPGGVGLKCYFDTLQISDYEKKSHVDHVRKLWNQRKYREKLEKNKLRQRNFVLADTTIKSLDKLANELGVSRTEALERLIELAARHGMPSAGKI